MDVNCIDDSVSMLNRERFFDVERERHVVVVEAGRYWNFYEGLLIGDREGRSKGGLCPGWNSFLGDSALPPGDFD